MLGSMARVPRAVPTLGALTRTWRRERKNGAEKGCVNQMQGNFSSFIKSLQRACNGRYVGVTAVFVLQ